jgi:lysozyme
VDLLVNVVKDFSKQVNKLIKVEVTQNQFDALVDFAYNVGVGNLASSTLLKKLNAKLYAEVAEQFLRWNKAGGVVLTGLTRRREAEKKLFLLK